MPAQLGRLDGVYGAALDGRTASVRFQQNQLIALHAKLQDLQADACKAILSDRGVTAAEAEVEYATTILAVREYYESIDFDKCVKQEYRIAEGQNSPARRVGFGVLLIRPTEHTRWYSIVATAAAAIAAGNTFAIEVRVDCAIILLSGTILTLGKIVAPQLYRRPSSSYAFCITRRRDIRAD